MERVLENNMMIFLILIFHDWSQTVGIGVTFICQFKFIVKHVQIMYSIGCLGGSETFLLQIFLTFNFHVHI